MFLHRSQLAHLASLAIGLALPALPAQVQFTPTESLAALKLGNQRFVEQRSLSKPLGEGIRRSLAQGQNPYAIIVTCSDSRVAPEHIFNAGLGEIFTIRVTGNVCDPETLASIEYAAIHLQTPLCVVLTHDDCQALEIAAGNSDTTPAMQAVAERLTPALNRAAREGLRGRSLLAAAERENAHETIAEAMRRSPALRDLSRAGRFRFAAASYALNTGEVEWLPDREISLDPAAKALHKSRLKVVHGASPNVAWAMIQAGYRRYMAETGRDRDLSAERRKALVDGERPLAIVVTCSDSRVVPDHIFDTGLGEIHVVRVAGNVLNDEVLASLETAVHYTGAALILVLGHDGCGAVTAAIDHAGDPHLSPSMRSLFSKLEPSVVAGRRYYEKKDEILRYAVESNVQRFLAQARSRSVLLRNAENQGYISMLGAVYSLDTGNLRWIRDDVPAAAPLGETYNAHADEHGSDDAGTHGDGGHDAEAHGSHDGGHGAATHGSHDSGHGAAMHGSHDSGHGATTHGSHDSGHGATHGSHGHAGGSHEEYTHGEYDEAEAQSLPSRGESILITLILALVVSVCGVSLLVFWHRKMASACAHEDSDDAGESPAADATAAEDA